MANIRYPSSSPYAATPQYPQRIGRYVHRAIPSADDDQTITVERRHRWRPDLLAHEMFGSAAYWWVFAETNPTLRLDPVFGMVEGLTLRVPQRDRLIRLIGG